ncbi:MAG: tRNA 4-thiouridine(8) synthase ThiI, partial [Oscillospiraceae bacterium]|nr:tRNA 4-thiouridine(8) synthase ThiI [Oscillospiraceae bacterium]
VAAWMMARRGCEIIGVHFMSPPYTGEGALYKVERLATKVAKWSNRFPVYEVPFTDCQVAIRDNCPEEFFTVIMRRSMLRIAQMVAKKEDCGAVVTGESLGQVASQTLKAIQCTDDVAYMPVFRPLIGTDKIEITDLARRIDTFDISIEPYEDCCTIFTPKHPRTRPVLDQILVAEAGIPGLKELEEEAFKVTRFKMFRYDSEDV